MRRSLVLAVLAALLAVTGGATFLVHTFVTPTVLKVAVGGPGSEDTRVVAALALALQREKANVRLRLVSTDGPRGSADAVQNGRTDLGVVRPDILMPTNAGTVAILRRDAAMFLVPPRASVRAIQDLRDKTIAIAANRAGNRKLLEAILGLYAISETSVRILEVPRADLAEAGRSGAFDVYFAVAPLVEGITESLLPDLSAPDGAAPMVLPIQEAAALAQRNPALEIVEIPRGAFGGAPARPAAPVPTLSVSHRLVASRGLEDAVVADLTRLLFEVRPTAARDVPAANRIEAPDTEDKGAALPVHPGTSAYLDGEEKSFIERNGDWMYLAIMGVSLAGSALAAFMSRNQGASQRAGTTELNQLLALLRAARQSHDHAVLDGVEGAADEVLAQIVARTADGAIEEPTLSALTMALAEVRAAIGERRRALDDADARPAT